MTDGIVIDASVGVKLILPEPGFELALSLCARKTVWTGPLFWAEVGNVLATRVRDRRLTQAAADEAWSRLLQRNLLQADETLKIVSNGLAIAHRLAHPVYDCIYLALAEQLSTILVTADERFLKAVAGDPRLAGQVVRLDGPSIAPFITA